MDHRERDVAPPLDLSLIEWLDYLYPEPRVSEKDTLQKVYFDAGQRAVVTRVRLELQRQIDAQDDS